MTSIGLRPAGLFFSLTGVNTAASISARKLSNGTTRAIISSGSPFAVIAASRLSASKNPNCPIVPTRESCCHNSDSHKSAEIAIFRGPLELIRNVVPTATIIALLVNPANQAQAERTTRDMETATRKIGLRLQVLHASIERDFDTVFEALPGLRADALIIGADSLFTSRREQLAALTVR